MNKGWMLVKDRFWESYETERLIEEFQKQDINYDINELQKAYHEILKIKNFGGPEGISNFGAISLTQIPGDPDSIKGHKARGVFWTKPDSSGNQYSSFTCTIGCL